MTRSSAGLLSAQPLSPTEGMEHGVTVGCLRESTKADIPRVRHGLGAL